MPECKSVVLWRSRLSAVGWLLAWAGEQRPSLEKKLPERSGDNAVRLDGSAFVVAIQEHRSVDTQV